MEEVFVANGYDQEEVKRTLWKTEQKVLMEEYEKVMNVEEFDVQKEMRRRHENMIRTVVPYPGDEKAGKMRRIAKKHGVSLAFSSSNTIKSGLIKLKEKTEIKKRDMWYIRFP